jgi:hypothetical protein
MGRGCNKLTLKIRKKRSQKAKKTRAKVSAEKVRKERKG